MTAPEPAGIVWPTSSYSGNCVQVAPALAVPATAWRTFLITATR